MMFLSNKHCAHSNLRPIYGDEVNANGGWRLGCNDCGRYIAGPVSLAENRRGEMNGTARLFD